MISVLRQALLLLMLLAATVRPGLARKCVGDRSVCHAYATADVVFIGRVVALNPDFDIWGRNLEKELGDLFPGRTMDEIEADESVETTAKLKQFYLSFWRGTVSPKVAGARTGKQLKSALEEIMMGGQTVRFEVHQSYKGLPPGTKNIVIHSEFVLGLPAFSAHETYLIYAHRGAGRQLEVGPCSRSKRVRNAGEDLAYLHFIQYGGRRSGRIYGFVTGDKKDQGERLDRGEVTEPVEDVLVALHAPSIVLSTTTDRRGSFIFDGLAPGEYEASVYKYEDWIIEGTEKLSGPRKVKVNERGCARILFQIDPPEKK